MTVFGDLDISLITELPAGRKPIVTKIVAPLERQATYRFVRDEIKKGRQAFVICPLIEATRTSRNGVRAHREAGFAHSATTGIEIRERRI